MTSQMTSHHSGQPRGRIWVVQTRFWSKLAGTASVAPALRLASATLNHYLRVDFKGYLKPFANSQSSL